MSKLLFLSGSLSSYLKVGLHKCLQEVRPFPRRNNITRNILRTFSSNSRPITNANTDNEPGLDPSKKVEGDGRGNKKSEQKRRNFRYYLISLAVVAGVFHFTGYASRKFRTDAASPKLVDKCTDVEGLSESSQKVDSYVSLGGASLQQTSSSRPYCSSGTRHDTPAADRQLQRAIKQAEALLKHFKV